MDISRTPLPGNISKIFIGDPSSASKNSYKVGNSWSVGGTRFTVSAIERDENNYFLFGYVCYKIWVMDDSGRNRIWKYVEGLPVMLEFDLTDDTN